MIDNFAIAFFTVCIIYTAYRAIKLERISKETSVNADKSLEAQQPESVLDDAYPRNPR